MSRIVRDRRMHVLVMLIAAVGLLGIGWGATASGPGREGGQAVLMSGVTEYIIVGSLLFALGLVGFLSRRNLIIIFLSTEVMFQGVVINAVAFARLHQNLDGQAYALFLLVIAAVEAGLALGMVMLLYRVRGTLDAETWSTMRG